jgi:hypothetical protein
MLRCKAWEVAAMAFNDDHRDIELNVNRSATLFPLDQISLLSRKELVYEGSYLAFSP